MPKKEAFVIMPIGNDELEKVWSEVYLPAIVASDLEPRRVDKHSEGKLVNSEVADFIRRGRIIIADLTLSRPNCYLEVGYTMGINKFNNLILCCREDHNPDSPNFKKDGFKVHFDLSGYEIAWWQADNLAAFKEQLIKVIKWRQDILDRQDATSQSEVTTAEWIKAERKVAFEELKKSGLSGYKEIIFRPLSSSVNVAQDKLLEIAEKATVHTFGWPIGVVMRNNNPPKPYKDGIRAVIHAESRESFDYWTLRKDGNYYLLASLFEDMRAENKCFFDTRTVRVTEVFMFCARLFKGLGFPDSERIEITIRHGGMKGRSLTAANQGRAISLHERGCVEDEVESVVVEKLADIMPKINDLVYKVVSDLFMMFDYFVPNKGVVDEIVSNYLKGVVR